MKKLISFILAAMLIFSVLPVGAATFTDSNADNSEEKIGLMTKLGILDADDVFSYNKGFEISRAAFLRIANRITKTSDLTAGTLPYWDVDDSNEYYKDIEAAYSFGLIDGGVGDSFRPYDIITYSEGAKIAAVMLGYKNYANLNGGYPFGYLTAAQSAGFALSGVGGGDKLSYPQAVTLLFNALTASMLEQSSYGDRIEFTSDNKNTILEKNFDIEVATGVVEATDVTSLEYGKSYSKNALIIGGVSYSCDDPEPYRGLLGYRVNCYYNNTDDFNDIVFAAKYRNKVQTVEADEIASISPSKVEYYDDNSTKKQTVDLNSSVTYVYNGKSIDYSTQYSTGLITEDDCGYIEFIDNDADGNYDVASIVKYVDFVAESVNKDDEIIYGKYNKGDSLLLDSTVKYSIYDLRGKSYTLSDIAKGTSLMAARSMDKKYVRLLYCDDIIEGRISSVNDTDEITINAKDYKISPEYLQNGSKLSAGTEGIFYLNAYGRIVNYEAAAMGGGVFGLLMKVERETPMSENVGISVMSPDEDEQLTFALENSVEIDAYQQKGADKILKALNPNGKTMILEVVRYWTNDNGKVYKIDTPTVSEKESADNTLIKRWTMSDSALGWKKSGRIGSKFYINTESGTLYGLGDTVESSSDVTVYAPGTLDDDASCAADIYSVGTDTVKVNVMVMKRAALEGDGGSGNKIPNSSYFCVFESYKHKLNDDGETIGVITYYDGAAKVDAYVAAEDEGKIPDLLKLKCGDAFFIKKDKKNYVKAHMNQANGYTNLYRFYDYENDEYLYDSSYNTGQWQMSTGIVYDLDDVYARVGSKGLNYDSMTYEEKDRQLTTYQIFYAYNGGGVYEVLRDGTLSVQTPSASTVNDYSTAGENADRLIAQREYGHDRRNCYFRHSGR